MNWFIAIASTVVIVIGVGAFLVGLFYFYHQWADRRRISIGMGIIGSGGPKNKEEYFFLFPEACRECGSRIIFENIVHYTFHSRIYSLGGYNTLTTRQCERGHELEFTQSTTYGTFCPLASVTKQPVHSMYITLAQEETIPQAIPIGGAIE